MYLASQLCSTDGAFERSVEEVCVDRIPCDYEEQENRMMSVRLLEGGDCWILILCAVTVILQ